MRLAGRAMRGLAGGGALLTLLTPAVRADVRFAPGYGDHMVLQRGPALSVQGMAARGERVEVRLGAVCVVTSADSAGAWRASLGAQAAGGPYDLVASAASGSTTLRDVLVGDVWFCSGQSNMEWPLAMVRSAGREVADSEDPELRLCTVAKRTAATPASDAPVVWAPSSPKSALGFSGVAFFFGKDLRAKLGVPIGLIHAAWGGTPAEAWVCRTHLAADPAFSGLMAHIPAPGADAAVAHKDYEARLQAWQDTAYLRDPGNRGVDYGWAESTLVDRAWSRINLPGYWERANPPLAIDGAVWFRRRVTVPQDWVGRNLTLSLGPIDDFDETYVNGVRVGGIGQENAAAFAAPRRYRVPSSLVKGDSLTISVRVFDRWGTGGFAGTPGDMRLAPAGSGADEGLPLHGEWRCKVEYSRDEAGLPPMPRPPPPAWNAYTPTGLHNAMLAPLTGLQIRGVVWYQGEANAPRAHEYRKLFPALIACWREAWGQPDLPFIFVQLANYTARLAEPADSDWAELREAQAMALSIPHTGMAVAIDVGDAADIHPRDKQTVGARLALAARAVAYGEKGLSSSGPTFREMRVEGERALIGFAHADGGLTAVGGGPLTGFAIAGADRRFVWAEARLNRERRDRVEVWSPRVTRPVAVRYGWANNPDCNLANGAGLPAPPFRTDDWPGITDTAR